MKTVKIIILIGLSCFIIISILALIIAEIYLTPEIIGQSLKHETKKYLSRDITFADIEVSLAGKIKLKDITLQKSLPWEKNHIVFCKEIDLNCRVFPLMFKKLFIKKITVIKPDINIKFTDRHPFSL